MSQDSSKTVNPPAETAMPSDAAPATGVEASTGVATDTSTTTTATGATVSVSTTTNGPIPDTAENREKYGKPLSNAGRRSKASGN